jgi:uncharacterized protein YtpQ (UPF0354 family)
MKKFLASLFCAIGVTGCARDTVLLPDAFTREYVAQLCKAMPQAKVEITRDLQLRVIDAAGKETTAFLDNCYSEYQSAPKDKDATIAKYVAAFAEPLIYKGNIDTARITPVIKDKAWLLEIREGLKARGAKEIPENVFEPLNDELVIVYAEDSPKNMRYLSPKDIEKSGLKKEGLRELAIKNLRTLLPKIEARGGNGVFMITAGGDYEASLLLFDEIWRDKMVQVEGSYIVAVPTRDLLLVTGSKDKAGIAKVREFARKSAAESAYHLIPDLFIYEGGHFVKFEE